MANSPITINGVRFSYCHLFQPQAKQGQEPKYSTTILLPKDNTAGKAAIDQAVAAAIEEGVSAKWNGVRPPHIPICVYDGDGVRPSDGMPFNAECKGHWVFTASSKNPPFVVDANVQEIINPAEVYSGMYGNVNVKFFAYNSGNKKGIGCGLNGVQKVSDGEALGNSRVTPAEVFQPVAAPAATPGYGAYPANPAAPAATPGYGAYPAASAATPGYGAPPAAPAATPGYGAPPAAPAATPGYGAYPAAPAATPGYGAYPAAPAATPGYGAPGQPYVDPNTGEVAGGYQPSGMPIAGI